jgi:hypothetical protein
MLKDELHLRLDRIDLIPKLVGWGLIIALAILEPNIPDWPSFLVQFGGWQQFWGQFKDTQQVFSFFLPKIPQIILISIVLFEYFAYRGAASKELDLVGETFSPEHIPRTFEKLYARQMIVLIGFALTFLYVVLVLVTSNIFLFCIICVLLHTADFIGSNVTLENIKQSWAKFSVQPDDRFTAKRRETLRKYYFENPILMRIALLQGITVLALLISFLSKEFSFAGLELASYILVSVNLIAGLKIIFGWRAKRNAELVTIDSEQEIALV